MDYVLGIESSCDDTAVALYHGQAGLLLHHMQSSALRCAPHGGVVPEIASREHAAQVSALTRLVLSEAGIDQTRLSGIAYTAGPGLIGGLLVGASFASSLAMALEIPAIGVHHLEAHLMAIFLEDNPPSFPFLGLIVSGGHTLWVDVRGLGDYRILGQTLDDAVGEAFDKTAKLLGLGYPGGALLSKRAQDGNPGRYAFPRPMMQHPGLDMSFSGLKTAVRQKVESVAQRDATFVADISASFEQAVVDVLVGKAKRAFGQTGYKDWVLAGGVAANQPIRQALHDTASAYGARLHVPRPDYCTDNGAMVAYLGWRRLQAGQVGDQGSIQPRARWPLDTVTP
jgi:N6-L-threonylcarbamoyladenine synthase